MLQIPAEIWRLLGFLGRHFVEDNCQTTAAALTYQTLFAVVPSLTVMYTVLSAFESFSGMGRVVEDFIFANVVPENVSVVQDYLRSFSDQARNLSVPSVILLAVTAFLMLFTIERTFNEIWRIREPRRGFQRVMMYWAVLTLGPLLVVLGIGVSTYLLSLPLISDVTDSPGFLAFLPLLMSALTFTLIYIAVPNTVVPVRHAVIGGVLVAIVFEGAKYLFTSVMSRSSFEVIYGTFAVVPLFLLWIYVSWTIVLVGAELVKGLGVYRFEGSHRLEAPLMQFLILLEVFFDAHRRGETVTEKMIRTRGARVDMEKWTDYRQKLMDLKLIRKAEKGDMVLSRDLGEVPLWELCRQLPWPLPAKVVEPVKSWESRLSETFQSISGRNEELLGLDIESLFRMPERKESS